MRFYILTYSGRSHHSVVVFDVHLRVRVRRLEILQLSRRFARGKEERLRRTDGPTDGRTDRRTDWRVCLGICFYRISDVTQAALGGMADGNFRSFDRRRREGRGRGREGGREKEGKWSIPSSSIVNLEVVGSTRGNQSEKGFMSV